MYLLIDQQMLIEYFMSVNWLDARDTPWGRWIEIPSLQCVCGSVDDKYQPNNEDCIIYY